MGDSNFTTHENKSWHIKKELSVSHLLTTLFLVISLLAWGSSVEKRLVRLEVQTVEWQRSQSEATIRIDSALVRIEAKLDKKVDRSDR